MKASTKLKSALQENKVLYLPGAYDGLSAKIAENEGARAIYATGGGIARSTGVPDMGLLSLDEIAHRLEQMVDAVEIPIVAPLFEGIVIAIEARLADGSVHHGSGGVVNSAVVASAVRAKGMDRRLRRSITS